MEFIPTNLPIENEYPKLIRDKIPKIVEKKGKQVKIKRSTSDEEFFDFLLKKVVEESIELQHSKEHGNTQEEIADVIEIIDTILRLKGWSKEDINTIQKEKREKNGGFEERLIMLEIPQ
jgi:predicted house-cleaning noncanonical NTP pyrophosphatase (MazG superfamily)